MWQSGVLDFEHWTLSGTQPQVSESLELENMKPLCLVVDIGIAVGENKKVRINLARSQKDRGDCVKISSSVPVSEN